MSRKRIYKWGLQIAAICILTLVGILFFASYLYQTIPMSTLIKFNLKDSEATKFDILSTRVLFLIMNEPIVDTPFVIPLLFKLIDVVSVPLENIVLLDECKLGKHNGNNTIIAIIQNIQAKLDEGNYDWLFIFSPYSRFFPAKLESLLKKHMSTDAFWRGIIIGREVTLSGSVKSANFLNLNKPFAFLSTGIGISCSALKRLFEFVEANPEELVITRNFIPSSDLGAVLLNVGIRVTHESGFCWNCNEFFGSKCPNTTRYHFRSIENCVTWVAGMNTDSLNMPQLLPTEMLHHLKSWFQPFPSLPLRRTYDTPGNNASLSEEEGLIIVIKTIGSNHNTRVSLMRDMWLNDANLNKQRKESGYNDSFKIDYVFSSDVEDENLPILESVDYAGRIMLCPNVVKRIQYIHKNYPEKKFVLFIDDDMLVNVKNLLRVIAAYSRHPPRTALEEFNHMLFFSNWNNSSIHRKISLFLNKYWEKKNAKYLPLFGGKILQTSVAFARQPVEQPYLAGAFILFNKMMIRLLSISKFVKCHRGPDDTALGRWASRLKVTFINFPGIYIQSPKMGSLELWTVPNILALHLLLSEISNVTLAQQLYKNFLLKDHPALSINGELRNNVFV